MLIDHRPLSFYVDNIRSRRPFSLVKHSDASLYCMQGKQGGDCNGCEYTSGLRMALIHSIEYRRLGYHRGIQRLTDRDNEAFDLLLKEEGISSSLRWIDTGIIPSQFVDGKLYPLVEVLRELGEDVCVVSNQFIVDNIHKILPDCRILQTPPSNTYRVHKELIEFISAQPRPKTYLFSCGMAACAMIPVLHEVSMRGYPSSSFIDIGHMWDALLGNKIRHYQKDLTQDHIDRNLRP